MNPKEKFLDRIEQTFMILIGQKDLLIWIALMYGGFSIITMILWRILINFMIFDSFFSHTTNYIMLITGWIAWLIIIFAQIWILLGIIKHLSDLNKWLPVSFKTSMLHGIQKIGVSCYTYYYIFIYTLFLPSLFLIGGISLIILDITHGKIGLGAEWLRNNGEYANTGLIFIGVSMLLTIYFGIYRWIRASFAIYKAADTNNFSKISFEKSLHLTDHQWVRIFGNLVWIGILVNLVMSVFNGIFSIWGSTIGVQDMLSVENSDITSIKHVMQSISPTGLWVIFSSILSGVGWVFSITFTYLLLKRLEIEAWSEGINRNKNISMAP